MKLSELRRLYELENKKRFVNGVHLAAESFEIWLARKVDLLAERLEWVVDHCQVFVPHRGKMHEITNVHEMDEFIRNQNGD